MASHSSRVAFDRPEQDADVVTLETVAKRFEALLALLERYEHRFPDHRDAGLAAAIRAAERGLALCNRPQGRTAKKL